MTNPRDPKDLARRRANLSPQQQELLARRLRGEAGTGRPTIRRREDPSRAPLSFSQERLWFLDQFEPGNPAFNENVLLRLRGTLNVEALEQSLEELVRRHEILRTRFVLEDERPVQRIALLAQLPLERVRLTEVPETSREEEVTRLARQEVCKPFELTQPVLLRALLIEVREDVHVLLLTNHHIISDGWSRTVLVKELMALYGAYALGQEPPLPELPIQYGDFAAWQREWLQGEVLAQQLAYWKQQLAAPRATLQLPTSRPRPPSETYRGAVHAFSFPLELAHQLTALARAGNATLYMVLLAAFDVLLYRLSGQTDIIVGSPTANRHFVETEGLIGFFVNSLVLRTDLSGEPSFQELLGRVREVTLEAYSHAELPFEKLVEELRPERDPSRAPLFQVMFTLQNVPTARLELPHLTLEPDRVDAGTARLDLTLEVIPTAEGGLRAELEYNTDLFDAPVAALLATRYLTLLEGVVENPGQRVSRLPLLSRSERQLLLQEWNGPRSPLETETTLVEQFEEQVRRTPDETALIGGQRQLTYREVNAQANRLARLLERRGVGPESRVGLCMTHGPELVVAMLAILKAGGAYVPLDPDYPLERLTFVLDDARVTLLVTEEPLRERLAVPGLEVLCPRSEGDALAGQSPLDAPARARWANTAYVLYTSGSTGRPKGVLVEHGNAAHFFHAMDSRVEATGGTWLALTSFAFDISVLELLWTLARGFRVVVPREDEVAEENPTPSALQREMQMSLFFFASAEEHLSGDKYRLLLESARFADQNHFTAVWTPERHFHSFGGLYPNPAITSAALAIATQRIQIRAGSVVLPLHNPIRIVEEWSVVDNLSHGRVGISFAAGWHADDFVLQKDHYADRRAIMLRDLDAVRRLWRGEALPFQNGAGNEIQVRPLPRPVQKELPFWLTASGDPKTFEAAGETGAGILTHLLGQSVEELAGKIARYREARSKAGHPGAGHVTLMLHTFVGDNLEEVKRHVRGPFCNYLRTSLDLIQNLARSMGVDVKAQGFTEDDMEALLGHAFERYFGTSSLMGTVDSCSQMVDRLRAIGVDELGCLIDFGVDADRVLASLPKLDELRRAVNAPRALQREPSLLSNLTRHGVTHFQCTPSLGRLLLQELEGLGKLRKLLVGGEAFPVPLARELSSRVPEVLNMYGPTETTVWSSTQHVRPGSQTVPIGRPIANTSFYILDEHLELVPIGATGELYIGGAGVARGYHGRPDLTASRFVPDPFSSTPGARLYRTGDLARWLPEGTVEFLGRNDHQIKLRGFRIELGEIENALGEHASVREAVVVVRGPPEDQRLVAYLVTRWGVELSQSELRAFLKERLPDFMLPSIFVTLESFPLTPNGKVDRKALPLPELARPALEGEYVAPRTALEHQLAELWAQALGIKQVGIHDDFFELGGHSLLATQLVAKIRSALRMEVPLRYFIEGRTVAALAERLEASSGQRARVQR
ncbi:LLM class flavin-dependent oxidoreductase [Stigmatella sp. ncwal1]|uniref:LLM class flavin-dependent oxidoreductase n=1 Tax=Stigmatella ashevillensis TaxID=2995309 RepID=A0ABT5DC41_9BACT|nr:MupA/Atu3671 family FMN-dependent luciferase-like monooxygenase [Stigmatella ashevillena]MDC0710660.1 LLM class flavin-dependent oxidoreductase [Stigmatella ashevillena]